jgi:hypothetical protein
MEAADSGRKKTEPKSPDTPIIPIPDYMGRPYHSFKEI